MQSNAGYGETKLPLSALFGLSSDKNKPALVYVYKPETDAAKAEASEARLFGSEDVVVASRLFRFFRIDESTVTDPAIRAQYLAKLPALIFLDPQGNEAETLNGPVGQSRVMAKLGKVFEEAFDLALKKQVAKVIKSLRDLEKAEDRVADLKRFVGAIQDRVDDRATPNAQRQLQEKQAELEAAYKVFGDLKEELRRLMQAPTPATAQN